MVVLTLMLFAQVMECPLEAELRLPPVPEYRPVELSKKAASKGFESWGGAGVELSRRLADGAVGLKVGTQVVLLKPMGILGVEGVATVDTKPVGFRIYRASMGYGSAKVSIQKTSGVYAAARCGGRLALFDVDLKGPVGVDTNGDGKVDVNSPAEYARVRGGAFEWDGRAFVLDRVDWKRQVLLMREAALGPKFVEGEVFTDFAYVDRLKETRRLSGHGSSYTLIDFWASWCGPCIGAFPQLKAIAETHDVKVLGVNGDEDAGAASRVLAQFEVLWPDVQSTEPGVLFDYRTRVGLYPTYLLLDASRKIVFRTESTVELIEEIRRVVPVKKAR
ncbi:MAG: TlpA disulfide reductase family protein [Acidobacteria bacterium]|nr:TlpA disulfide reductase family protein [Acidobacteriota bacterium]